ncbi:ferrochelatase [uncultured Corynebacterium sp.]|uniref:ferrochelatase n=1 Tax=uncultured Corynebacterium sp. TaxID=159447 RepID=UPI0025EB0003|nr:ferrochelatase [uncultured Corynebacterium sp.]
MAQPASQNSHRALLVLSFGGPEKNEDVIPFLENVTRGRGIPRERLAEVGEHYFAMDGKSPITDQNLRIIADLESLIAERVTPLSDGSTALPVYFGNRNWHPFVEDTVAQMARDGVTEALVLATSAWGGYSGHVQYLEDIARAEASCRDAGLTPPTMTKIRPFHDHPLFRAAFARLIDETRAAMPADQRQDARLLFAAHSIPVSADETSSADSTHRYSGQVITAAREIRELSSFAVDGAAGADVELVWQSRSGPPHIPWLEPDICDFLEATVAGEGMASASGEVSPGGDRRPVLLCPVGFITDHMEVIWDLDTEARDTAAELGVPLVRVPTPGLEPEFPRMILDLVHEHWADIPGEDAGNAPDAGAAAPAGPAVS